MRRTAGRPPRLPDSGLSRHQRRLLPAMRRQNPWPLGHRVRGPAHRLPLFAPRPHAATAGLIIPMVVLDTFDRPLRNLRLSVTDRCNLRCSYCMPEQDYVWLPREDLLNFEEIERLVDVFIELGVDKVRLTGGEPLLRRDLPALVTRLAARPAIRELAMTTNGVLLAPQARTLR